MLTNAELRNKYADYRETFFYWYATNGIIPLSEEEMSAAWLILSDFIYSVSRKHYKKPQSYRSPLTPRTQNFYDVPRNENGIKYYHFHVDRMAEFVHSLRNYNSLDFYMIILIMCRDSSMVKIFLSILPKLRKKIRGIWWVMFNYKKFFPAREVVRHYAEKGISVPINSALVITKIELIKRKYGDIFTPEEEGSLCNSIRQGVLYSLAKPYLNQVSLEIVSTSIEGGEKNVTSIF